MTTPRPHADMSELYMSNSTLKCWYWTDKSNYDISEFDDRIAAYSEEQLRSAIKSADRANQAEAVPLFWYRPLKDGLYEGPIHANLIFGKSYREENPSEWRPFYTAPPTQAAAAMSEAYEAGWAECACRANRSDLVSDIDSPAYITDLDAALAAFTPNHFADAGKPITKGAL